MSAPLGQPSGLHSMAGIVEAMLGTEQVERNRAASDRVAERSEELHAAKLSRLKAISTLWSVAVLIIIVVAFVVLAVAPAVVIWAWRAFL